MADPLVCYLVSNGQVSSTNQYFPCGSSDISGASAQSCCNAEDYCMDSSICHYTRGGVTNGTGYYMAGCTDPKFEDPACPQQCSSEFRPEIIYDRAASEWRCCDSTENSLNCQNPSEFIVKAADPQELSTILQLSTPAPSSTVATSITSITSSPTTTSANPTKTNATTSPTTTSPSQKDDTSTGLTLGAKAGIAMAIITIFVLLIGLFLFWRIRSSGKPKNETKKHKSEESRSIAIPPNPYKPKGPFKALNSNPNSALPSPAIMSPPTPGTPGSKFDSRRDSEFPISLHEPEVRTKSARFSYEVDIGPYEMDSPMPKQRVPYERPMSAQELEGTRVQVQELDSTPADKDR